MGFLGLVVPKYPHSLVQWRYTSMIMITNFLPIRCWLVWQLLWVWSVVKVSLIKQTVLVVYHRIDLVMLEGTWGCATCSLIPLFFTISSFCFGLNGCFCFCCNSLMDTYSQSNRVAWMIRVSDNRSRGGMLTEECISVYTYTGRKRIKGLC